MTTTENRIEQIAGIAAVAFLVIGCFVVLRPFVSAMLWAAILCFSTWPLYSRLERFLKGRRTLAATLMTVLITLVLVAPFMIAGMTLADNITEAVRSIRALVKDGLPDPPPWVEKLPLVGKALETYWTGLALNSDQFLATLKDSFMRSKGWFLESGLYVGQGVIQLSLSVFIAFFFYRDGVTVVARLHDAGKRIIGDRTQYMLDMVGATVKGVVYGILGTALAQGILAGIGFWIVGAPATLLLALLTFFLGLVPMGPPLVWGPVALWLFNRGFVGWSIFMAIYGTFVISGIDNVLKPYLISRGSKMPFALVFLGVFGGVIAFGFIGVFLGPTLLAVGYSLVQEWCSPKPAKHA